jgi:hypothetical protein
MSKDFSRSNRFYFIFFRRKKSANWLHYIWACRIIAEKSIWYGRNLNISMNKKSRRNGVEERCFEKIGRMNMNTRLLTLPFWIFVLLRNVWGRFGYLILRWCRRASARSTNNSILSISDIESFMMDHDVRTGDLPLTWSVTFTFQANIAASNLLMTSRAQCSNFKLRELSVLSDELDSANKNF